VSGVNVLLGRENDVDNGCAKPLSHYADLRELNFSNLYALMRKDGLNRMVVR
jgi:hypothetical protein